MGILCKFLLLIILCSWQLTYGQNEVVTKSSNIILKADKIEYDATTEGINAKGNIYVSMGQYLLVADRLYYDLKKDVLFAEGNIKIQEDDSGKIILAQRAVLKDKLKKAVIDEFILKLQDGAIIVAAYAVKNGTKKAALQKASFTACKTTCNNQPIWQIKAQDTNIDYEKERITYRNMFFEIYGIPIIYLPYFSHPTPTAPAQSGILMPQIKDDNLTVPFYFRAKSNLDFTISPRVARNYMLVETQIRHLLKDGSYVIDASSGNPSNIKEKQNGKLNRYYILAKGDFHKNNMNYGFDAKHTSDKAYLVNYYQIYDSYLESKIYANTIYNNTDYFALDAISFQDLRSNEKKTNTPIILPRMRTQNIFGINNDETILFTIKNNTIGYNENYDKQVARNALTLALSTNMLTENGNLFNFALSNRNDLYIIDINNSKKNLTKHQILTRNIPEFEAKWRYPLVKSFNNDFSLKLEPISTWTMGLDYNKNINKFAVIDNAHYELSEYNIFHSNRFSGLDYHDYGKRLSYGLNSSLFRDPHYFDAFIGQIIYQNNIFSSGNLEYVGNVSVDFANNTKLYYRFRKDKNFNNIRNEASLKTFFKKWNIELNWSKLNNTSKYYANENFKFPYNKISQMNLNLGYQIFDFLKLDTQFRMDITKKTKILYRTIMVTYEMDCVSIALKFYDDYLYDKSRNIKKNHTHSFVIGLKTLNM